MHFFQSFPQPKAIRGNTGYFHQDIYFPGMSTGNQIAQNIRHVVQKPILPLTNFPKASTPLPPLEEQPIIVENIPVKRVDTTTVRSIQNRHRVASLPLPPAPISTTSRPRTTTEPETSEELEEQSRSAYYKFGTSVHDTINDHEHVRQEVREGLALKGMYSYSDGFFRRTVYYEADEGGYRVVKEEIQPIGDGPKFNPEGEAAVKSTLTGDYNISIDDFRLNRKQEEFLQKREKKT